VSLLGKALAIAGGGNVMRSVFILAAALIAIPAAAAGSQEKPAATMRELQTYFAACFRPPREADGTRITFYFSLKSDGEIYGQPRLVWLGYSGNPDDKKRLSAEFRDAFQQCLPLRLNAEMARTIPGKVYFLQYNVSPQGTAQVMLRPFGSMGDPLVDVPEGL
jgi:hypothetical protein